MWQNRDTYDIWPEGEGASHIGGGGLPMGASTSVGASAYTEDQVKDFVIARCAEYAADVISILKTVNTGYGYGDDRDNTALAMVMNWLVWGADEFVGLGGGYKAFCTAIDYSLKSSAREDDVWDAVELWHRSHEATDRNAGKKRWLDMRKIIQEVRTNTTLVTQLRNFIKWYHWNNAVSEGPRIMNKDAVKTGITSLGMRAPTGAVAFAITDWNTNWDSSWTYTAGDTRQHWHLGLYENGDDVPDYVTDT
jgi:hypothetical protein